MIKEKHIAVPVKDSSKGPDMSAVTHGGVAYDPDEHGMGIVKDYTSGPNRIFDVETWKLHDFNFLRRKVKAIIPKLENNTATGAQAQRALAWALRSILQGEVD